MQATLDHARSIAYSPIVMCEKQASRQPPITFLFLFLLEDAMSVGEEGS